MSSKTGVELKGGMYTFMSLKLNTSDTDIIDQQIADKVQQAPAFFKDTPVVLDFSVLETLTEEQFDANELVECVRRHKLVPIVASLSNKSSPLGESIAIPLIEGNSRDVASGKSSDKSKDKPSEEQTDNEESDEQDSEETLLEESVISREVEFVVKAPMFINKPVRSGQQIYARDTDLIIMGSVAPGAEVIADNNIHIYGPLRGRALCGVSGNASTRIFCSSLEAELVSVAGSFRMLETIPPELRGKPAQIWLDDDKLNIEPL